MILEILSPEQTLYRGEVERVTLPGTLGTFTVLKHHAPLLSTLKSGVIRFQEKGEVERSVTVQGGFAEVKDNVVSVCVQ